MCARMYCNSTGDEISSVNELMKFVTPEFLVIHEGVFAPGESKDDFLKSAGHCCLCPVDVAASFVGNKKWSVRPDHDFFGDWKIIPRQAGKEGGE